jgi:alpha-L-fucosidase 2
VRSLSRRLFLGATSAAFVLARPAFARASRTETREQLRYLHPASTWNEALPIGNGRLGAMIFGRVAQERLQLNEDTLWAGSPYTPDNPEALAAVPEVRRLLAAGNYVAATALASEKVMAKPLRQMPYGSLGDILIDLENQQAPSEYERKLDLPSAVTSVRYRTSAGEFLHEAFASAPDDVIVWRRQAFEGKYNLEIHFRPPREAKYTAANYEGSATVLGAIEKIDWLAREEERSAGIEVQLAPDGDGAMLITGRNWENSGVAAGLTFALRLAVVSDGRVEVKDGRIQVRNAREVVLLLAAATSYVDFRNISADPVVRARRTSIDAARKSFAALKRTHLREYQPIYKSASLELASTETADLPTDVRIANETADDPALAALYFQFARYLLISSSRPGCQPANLQGLWNEGTNPPWGSKYTININTEMNYWPADAAGLSVCVEPLLRMVEQLAQSGAQTAKTMYGARGWVAHHNTDLWRAAAPIDGPMWGLWPCGGAWLCNTLWDHYDYTRKQATLERVYPLMRGASVFFLDTLIEDPGGRGLVTSPSLSPENSHPFGSSLCVGPAMDRQILRDLFGHTIEAARIFNDGPLLEELTRARQRLAPDVIGKSGQLQEWLEDWDDAAPDPHHRHVSHLHAVYPSSQINMRDTPALIDAAKVSLSRRGDLATGWGTAWRLCLWARMGEAEHAHLILKALLGPKRTYPNMFDAHPPFQIDGNFGGAAGILEMLVQSWGNELRLLPALPQAWPAGSVRGICARGALRLDMDWRSGKVEWFELTGPAHATVKVCMGATNQTISLGARGRYRHARR